MNFLQIKRPIPEIEPQSFEIFGYHFGNSTFFIVFIALLFLALCFFLIRKFKLKPGKTQSIIEILYESMFNLVKQMVGNEENAKRIFPVIGALLAYITVANLISLVPGLSSITYLDHEVLRVPTTDFNTTFGLAFGSVIMLQVVSIAKFGFWGHLNKFIQLKGVYLGFKKGIGEGMMAIVHFFVGILELVGEFARIISLSFRLFGNLYAHEVLAIVIFGALAYVLPVVWSAFGILVGFVQALVFGSLIAVYYSLSVSTGEEEH